MVDSLEIGPMRTKDVNQVIEIEKRSFPTPWSRHTYISEIKHNDRAYYFVAKTEGKVVGYGGMWLVAGEGHITNLAVHSHYRRQGIATRLLDVLAAETLKRGADKLTLEVRTSNVEAQLAYKKQGFLSVGIRPGYYLDNSEDALIMWKDLKKELEILG